MNEIQILFSGHRGYHIHIESEALQHLDQNGRREIVDYITGQGFSVRLANFGKIQGGTVGFKLDQLGWPGKYTREFRQILMQDDERIKKIFENNLNESIIKLLLEQKQFLLYQIHEKKPMWNIKGIGEKNWIQILEVLRQNIMADVDVVVSIDLHRLIRLEGSIHGKSGFRVLQVDFNNLKKFDPLVEALAFPHSEENYVSLRVTSPIAPKIEINNTIYGPFTKDEEIKVPLNVALFFLCKEVVDIKN